MTSGPATGARKILYDVMLSYRSDDSALAYMISNELSNKKFKVWQYKKDGVVGSDSLYKEAKEAIEQSRVYLLLIPQDGLGKNDRFWQNPRADADRSKASVTQLELLHAIEVNGGWARFQERITARGGANSQAPLELPIMLYYLRRASDSSEFNSVPCGAPEGIDELPYVDGFAASDAAIGVLIKSIEDLFTKAGWSPLGGLTPPDTGGGEKKRKRAEFEVLAKWEEKLCAQAAGARAPHLVSSRGASGFMLPLSGESGTEKYGRGRSGIEPAFSDNETPSVGVERGVRAPLHSWFAEGGPKFVLLSGPQGAGKTAYLRWLGRVAGKSLLPKQALSKEEEEVGQALRRTLPDGSATWPVPLWLDAEKLVERLEVRDRQDDYDHGVDSLSAMIRQLAGSELVDERLEVRPYLVLVDGLNLLTARQRNRLLNLAYTYTILHKDKPIQLVAAIRQSAMDDARDPSHEFAQILSDVTSGWDEIRICPLSLTSMDDFLDGQNAKDSVLVDSLRKLIGRVEREKDADVYLSTPLGLALAVRRGDAAEDAPLDGRLLMFELLTEFFSNSEAEQARVALGPVAAALVSRGEMEFCKADLLDVAPLCDLDVATVERIFESIKEGQFADYVGPVERKGRQREPRCRFSQESARDLFAADYLSEVAGEATWIEVFDTHGIWSDMAADGSRWRPALEILLVALVAQDQLNAARRVTAELLRRQQRCMETGHGRALWSLLLDVALRTPHAFDPGLGSWTELLDNLEEGYETYRPSWNLEARDRSLTALTRLERVRDRSYPKGVNETTSFSGILIDGKPHDIQVANAPVLVRHYERFILALERDSAGLARLFASDFDIEKSVIRWRAPSRWLQQQLAGPDRPVVDVTWHEAVAYCRWLQEEIENGREVEFGVELDPKSVIRLPAFDEWQQIKLLATDPKSFPSSPSSPGRDATAIANCAEAHLRRPATVGLFGPQESGLFDFASNVREWASVGTRMDRNMFADRRVNVLGVSYNYSWSYISNREDYSNQTHQTQPDIGFRWIVGPPREMALKG